MRDQLLDLTILDHLAQLERQAPGLIKNQLSHVDDQWPQDLRALTLFHKDNKINEMKYLLHKLRGHRGMIGLQALSDEIARMEEELASGRAPQNWASQLRELEALQQQSLQAARSYLDQTSMTQPYPQHQLCSAPPRGGR
jgi:hypothetical protein